jgi:opacity protein-like surface antigen
MKYIVLAVLLAAASSAAMADERQACQAADGAYLSGVVVKGPKFAHGQYRQGVELSHTHLKLRADQDGQVYDVAIDNVFANGYQPGSRDVPAPIDTIRVNDRLSLCGQLYDRGVGIHFVHTNCGQPPSSSRPDGWIRVVDGSGRAGPNLESNTNFCPLFNHGRRRR